MTTEPEADYVIINALLAGETVARTVEIRPDLQVDVDHAGRVLGVERIGGMVRTGDLEDVLRECVMDRGGE